MLRLLAVNVTLVPRVALFDVFDEDLESATPAARMPPAAAVASASCRVLLLAATLTSPVMFRFELLAIAAVTWALLDALATVAETPINKPPVLAPAYAFADLPLVGSRWLAETLRLFAVIVPPTVAVTTGASVTSARETPTETPVLTVRPVAVTSAFGCALALTVTLPAVTVEPVTWASTVGLTVALTTDPEAAAAISPILEDVALTREVAVDTSLALTTRSVLSVRVLVSTNALVVVSTVASADAPPPASETPRLTLAATAAACAVADIVAVSSAWMFTPPALDETVAERMKASTSFAMRLLDRPTPMATDPEIKPAEPATDAAVELAVIVDVSVALRDTPLVAVTPPPRALLPSMYAYTLVLTLFLTSAPAPAPAAATAPPAIATEPAATFAVTVAFEVAVWVSEPPATMRELIT